MRAPAWGYGVIRTIRNAGLVTILSVGTVYAEPVTIAALGDSLTQGFGLPADQGFVPQLSRWLEAKGANVELINAGVSGDTTAGGLSRIAWTLTDDVDALIVALGGNDLLRGIDPAVSRANLEGILEVAGDRDLPVLLIGMDAPPNYGADFEQAFDVMYPELSDTFGTLYYPNFLGALADRDDQVATLRDFMQGDGIHPNAEGVALIVEGLGPEVLKLVSATSD